MEKRIYLNLAIVATITGIITASIIVVLFYGLYNSEIIDKSINLKSMFLSTLPAIVGVLVFVLILLYLVSYMLTINIIKPIKTATQSMESILSGEDVEYLDVYDELIPFIRTVQIQKIEMEEYISKLRTAEKNRRNFTANVSHELKTPLTSINGFAEMLATGKVNKEDTVKFANIIHKEGTHLLELIDSIINLSRIEDETSSKAFEIINMAHMGNEIISQLKIRAKNNGLDLNLETEDVSIHGNKRMLKDLLYNLVDNAIKYNKPGGKVDVFIGRFNDSCIIKVKDTGIGIPYDEQDKVFERFYMVDKHIVKYHGGKISLTSQLDEGTKIEIRIPMQN